MNERQSRRGWSQRTWGTIGVVAILGAVLLSSPGFFVRASVSEPPTAAPIRHVEGKPTMAVEVTPTTATTYPGGAVKLQASIVPGIGGCRLGPMATSWVLQPSYGAPGALNATEGLAVTFTAYLYASGGTTIQFNVSASLDCNGTLATDNGTSLAFLVVAAPLTLSPWIPATDLVLPGQSVRLNSEISGGAGPFEVQFDFGDGNSTEVTEALDGPVTLDHPYEAGIFHPAIQVTDVFGAVAWAPTPDPLFVASNLSAAIRLSSGSLDSGVPFTATVDEAGGVAPYTVAWTDSQGDTSAANPWSLELDTPGLAMLNVSVTDALGRVTEANRTIVVSAPLNLSATVASAGEDIGSSFPVVVHVAGGTAPYTVTGTILPSGSTFTVFVTTPGNWTEPVVSQTPGFAWLHLAVTDTLGENATRTVPLLAIAPPPAVAVNVSPTDADSGARVALLGVSTGGTPPLTWSIATSGDVPAATGMNGTLGSDGLLSWSAPLTGTGTALLLLRIVDGAGVSYVRNFSIDLAPPLQVEASVPSDAPTSNLSLPITVNVVGGEPPYAYAIQMSDGEGTSGTLSVPGRLTWDALPTTVGALAVRVNVTDSLGAFNATSLAVLLRADPVAIVPPTLPVPPSDPTPSSPVSNGSGVAGWAVGAGAVLALLGLAGGGWYWWRRRPTSSNPPGGGRSGTDPNALLVVRRILREGEGLDASTVQLLAEEEGIDREEVTRALGQWRSAGRVRTEEDGEGSERFSWAAPRPRGTISGEDGALPP
ncbi:MAG: hypothetical protein L3K03_03155 [Thermoplasmata archaeon]|nr:hypothetical protein [Thermoplasmata archaeon]